MTDAATLDQFYNSDFNFQMGTDAGFVALNPFMRGGVTFTVDTTVFYNFAQAVPEPATWIMMIAGFGMIGALARRRNGHEITKIG